MREDNNVSDENQDSCLNQKQEAMKHNNQILTGGYEKNFAIYQAKNTYYLKCEQAPEREISKSEYYRLMELKNRRIEMMKDK